MPPLKNHEHDHPRSSIGLAEWLSIAQLIALVFGGLWVAFLFFRFDAKERAVTLEQHRLELQKTDISLSKLAATPLLFDQDITVSRFQPGTKTTANGVSTREVDYHFAVTNNTNQKIEIALLVIQALSLSHLPMGEGQFYEVPPMSVGKDSPWKREISKAYLAEGEELQDGRVESLEGLSIVASKGDTFVGNIEPGQLTWGTLTLIVSQKTVQFVGFQVNAFVRFKDGATRWIGADEFAPLWPGDYAGSPLSPAKAKGREEKDTEEK